MLTGPPTEPHRQRRHAAPCRTGPGPSATRHHDRHLELLTSIAVRAGAGDAATLGRRSSCWSRAPPSLPTTMTVTSPVPPTTPGRHRSPFSRQPRRTPRRLDWRCRGARPNRRPAVAAADGRAVPNAIGVWVLFEIPAGCGPEVVDAGWPTAVDEDTPEGRPPRDLWRVRSRPLLGQRRFRRHHRRAGRSLPEGGSGRAGGRRTRQGTRRLPSARVPFHRRGRHTRGARGNSWMPGSRLWPT